MASVTTNFVPQRAKAPLGSKLLGLMENLARLSPTYRRVEALSDMSDADLAAQGTTRQDAARRIFGARLYA